MARALLSACYMHEVFSLASMFLGRLYPLRVAPGPRCGSAYPGYRRGGSTTGLWFAMMVPVVLAGCDDDECELGTDHCNGDVAMVCEEEDCHTFGCGGNSWLTEQCAAACVEGPEGPFCALSHEPDPVCPHPDDIAHQVLCDGDDIVYCKQGFATDRLHCADTDSVCASHPQQGSFCALSREPDPRCPADGTRAIPECIDDTVVECAYGFARAEHPCQSECEELDDGGVATCSD